MKRKKIILFLIIILLLILALAAVIYESEKIAKSNAPILFGLLFSDSLNKDSELKFFDNNLKNTRSIKIKALSAPLVSNFENNIYIPTSFDDKLFTIDKDFKVSRKVVDKGGSFIKTKKGEQLNLFNLPIGNINRISFTAKGKVSSLDISNSLMVCGDFDSKYIYIVGAIFDNAIPKAYLFIIDKISFKMVAQKELPFDTNSLAIEIIDNKLFIGVPGDANGLLYYDISTEDFKKINFNKLIKNREDITDILYNKNYIFYVSFSGDIIKVDRKKLSIDACVNLNNYNILSADIKEDKLYTLSSQEKKRQIGVIDIIDCNTLKKINEFSVGPIRQTMPMDIFIYR